jgi:hypothetical protein
MLRIPLRPRRHVLLKSDTAARAAERIQDWSPSVFAFAFAGDGDGDGDVRQRWTL